MEEIFSYLKNKYNPLGIIIYGSYADGTNNENSDFDVLVITNGGVKSHDNSVVCGILLDAFIYPYNSIRSEDFPHIYGGKIALDTDGISAKLMEDVETGINNFTVKNYDENRTSVAWCEKMLLRVKRGDGEGYFRLHWLLTESLEIYCDVIGKRYLGPKKSMKQMRLEDAESAKIYENALMSSDYEALCKWIYRIKELLK